ncbi:MAG: GNAT family N-acetyltransferase [Spirochaetales bacterium]|nr:GNAT family N-acetyltransferase [Spirochaetales bacterium]
MRNWKQVQRSDFPQWDQHLATSGAPVTALRAALTASTKLWRTTTKGAILALRQQSLWLPWSTRSLTAEEGAEVETLVAKSCGNFTVMGLTSWTRYWEPWWPALLTRRVEYLWMTRACQPIEQDTLREGQIVRWAFPQDAEEIFPLQEAYEKEEVLFDPADFCASSSYWLFQKQLQTHWNVVLEEDGIPLAKAGTNALIPDWGQLGGVFTRPDRRGEGLQRRVLQFLLAELARTGRGACLFVKVNNHRAQKLYQSLGFSVEGPFEITYWQK